MSERNKPTGTDEEMRPIPDGGLSGAMPDWLRRPPAWRDLPRKDEPAAGMALPEPDTSVIDPRELVTVDDLPQWLRDIAAREPGTAPTTAPDRPDAPTSGTVASAMPDTAPEPTSEPRTIELAATPEDASAPAPTQLWIWALRAAIILIILAIIVYVFIL